MKDSILVIGASSDLGIEFVKENKSQDYILAHYFQSRDRLENLKRASRDKLEMFQADLSSEDEIDRMITSVEQDYGTPKKLVFLAAPRVNNIRFKDISWEDFDRDLQVSLKSTVLILRRFLPKLAKERQGKVVVVLSSYVEGMPPKALSHYVTAKYALLGLTKALASEYSDRNIQINAVSPSMIETQFLQNLNPKLVELNAYRHPLRRNATPKDVIPTINMLLSSDSDFITGSNIQITGGSTN